MIALIGTSWPVFIGVTVMLAGTGAYLAGQALAAHWRPMWHVAAYVFLLGVADRFIIFALFDGQLGSLSGYCVDTAVLLLIGLLSYRHTRARHMVRQYPWMYRPRGLFGWYAREES